MKNTAGLHTSQSLASSPQHVKMSNKSSSTKPGDTTFPRCDGNVKITVVGDESVGKTCICLIWDGQTISDDIWQFGNKMKRSHSNNVQFQMSIDNKLLEFSVWDTYGTSEFDRLRPLSYPRSNIFLLCFDTSNLTSLQHITQKWYPECNHHMPGTPFMLLGLKSDLRFYQKFITVAQNHTRIQNRFCFVFFKVFFIFFLCFPLSFACVCVFVLCCVIRPNTRQSVCNLQFVLRFCVIFSTAFFNCDFAQLKKNKKHKKK